jgi:hypothetical protein
MRNVSNILAIMGGVTWALLAGWHALIFFQFGWPEPFWFGHLLMAGPAIALAVHVLIFSFRKARQSYLGLGLEVISLLLGAALGYVEVSMHFMGYE